MSSPPWSRHQILREHVSYPGNGISEIKLTRAPLLLNSVPGSLPILGHSIAVFRGYTSILHFWLAGVLDFSKHDISKKGILTLPFHSTYYLTSDPRDVEFVLKTSFENFEKGPVFHSRFHDLLGDGIFATDGEEWRLQRKTAANIFNVKNFRDLVAKTFADELEVLYSRLDSVTDSASQVDLQDLFFRFTLDSFMRIGYGVDLGSMASDLPVPFAVAFDRAQGLIDARFFTPAWKFVELLSPRGWQHRKDLKVIRNFGEGILVDRRAAMADGKTFQAQNSDLLTYFLAVTPPLSSTQLVDYVLNFIIAGRDTTAQSLSWCFLELSQHPEVEQKLLEEINRVFGDEQEVTYENIKELKYAKAVFYETLRLHPSVPKEVKFCTKDQTLPDGTTIPKGAGITWSPWAMGRHPTLWGPTCLQFNPDRFLNATFSSYQFPAFNAGPRVCLGKAMAELEGVYVMVMLVRRYKIRLAPEEMIRVVEESLGPATRVRYANSLTLPMKDGLQVVLERRVK